MPVQRSASSPTTNDNRLPASRADRYRMGAQWVARTTAKHALRFLSPIAIGVLAATANVTRADTISGFYIFGDSSSDLGSTGQRPTNLGTMWGERLGGYIGIPSTIARSIILDETGVASSEVAGGNNYAINGATAVHHSGVATLADEVDFFVQDWGRFKKNDLVMVWLTHNDITSSFFDGVPYDPEQYASRFVDQIKRLKQLGARNIVSFGAEENFLPLQLFSDAGVPTDLVSSLSQATRASEQALWPQLRDQGVFVLDLNKLTEDVSSNLGSYGLSYGTESYLGRDNPDDTTPPDQIPNDGNAFTGDGHYTTAMQDIISDYALVQLRARDQFTTTLVQSAFALNREAMNYRVYLPTPTSLKEPAEGSAENWEGYSRLGFERSNRDARSATDSQYNSDSAHLVLGTKTRPATGLVVGAELSVDHHDGNFDANGNTAWNSYLLTSYGQYRLTDALSARGSIALGYLDYTKLERRARLGQRAVVVAQGQSKGRYVQGSFGLDYSHSHGAWIYTFDGDLAVDRTTISAYDEAPGVLSLSYGTSSVSNASATFSFRTERDPFASGWQPFLYADLGRQLISNDVSVKLGPTRAMQVPYLSSRPYDISSQYEIGLRRRLSDNIVFTASQYLAGQFGHDDKKMTKNIDRGINLSLQVDL